MNKILGLALLLGASGCGSVVVGTKSPPLDSGKWLNSGAPAEAPDLDGRWVLVEFFAPM